MFNSDFYLSLALVFFVNLAGHFAPGFRKPIADAGAYIKSYVFGSGSILICAGIWAWLVGRLALLARLRRLRARRRPRLHRRLRH